MSREIGELRAGVVGTGFIGAVHVEALRRLGVEVAGVVGSSPERARAKPLAPVVESYERLLEDERVDVVHLTTPNHLHYAQVEAGARGGEARRLREAARDDFRASRPSCWSWREAERRRALHQLQHPLLPARFSRRGRSWRAARWAQSGTCTARYLQDWLLLPTDWNWRLEPEKGGELRAVADIGSHWLDLVQFVVGMRVDALLADLATTIPVRRRPAREIETFAAADDVEREDAAMATEDLAHILLRFEDGTRGSRRRLAGQRRTQELAPVRSGRLERLARLGLRAKRGALARSPRDSQTSTCCATRRCSPRRPAPRTGLPGGHAEGFADTVQGALPGGLHARLRPAARRSSRTTRRSRTATGERARRRCRPSATVNDDGWR